MSPLNQKGLVVSQNTGLDDGAFQPGIAQPFSQSEIDDLIYADDRPTGERLDRLREIRDEVRARASIDYVDEDQAMLLAEIGKAIEQLERRHGEEALFGHDPLEHREALSPDSDEYEALADEDDYFEQEEEALPRSWDEGDDFKQERH